MGLLSHVVASEEVRATTRDLAEAIASFSGQVIADGKRAFYDMADITDEEPAYRHAVLAVVENTLQPDSPEGTRAFLEKRVPVWRHRQG